MGDKLSLDPYNFEYFRGKHLLSNAVATIVGGKLWVAFRSVAGEDVGRSGEHLDGGI
jgi:hypothetical protein